MPDLTIEVAATCSTNESWSTQVKGSKGDLYTVRFCRQFTGPVQYDYECSCKANSIYHQRCKHIEQVIAEKRRCGWNAELEPTLKAPDGKCPQCGADVAHIRVGV